MNPIMGMDISDSELRHHGVKGMKWGVRRFQDKSGRLTAAGKKRYSKDGKSGETESDEKKPRLSDNQKKALKIGAAVAATAIVAYGGYKLGKSGKLDGLINRGKKSVPFAGSVEPEFTNGLKKLAHKESMSEAIKNANPLRGTPEGKNNCVPCGIATYMRSYLGLDVVAKGTGGNMLNMGGVVEECFKKGPDVPNYVNIVRDGGASTFAKSQESAANMLVRRFGENASGVVSVPWKGGGGHCFCWETKNGVVKFMDGQIGAEGEAVGRYWSRMDPNGRLQLARLDNLELNYDAVKKYVGNR